MVFMTIPPCVNEQWKRTTTRERIAPSLIRRARPQATPPTQPARRDERRCGKDHHRPDTQDHTPQLHQGRRKQTDERGEHPGQRPAHPLQMRDAAEDFRELNICTKAATRFHGKQPPIFTKPATVSKEGLINSRFH
jgi:hypothetical protein